MDEFRLRSLSPQESRVVLGLAERKQREAAREDIIGILGVSPQAADHVIRSLRRKGWLERASWGRYLLIPPDQGPEALGESNLLALASRVADPYYIGYGTAATHYGLTTQHRNVIWVATPKRLRDRPLLNARVVIVTPAERKFFGFGLVDVLGYEVMMSDREKTAIDCIDRPDLAGGIGEAATVLARACAKLDWNKTAGYLERIDSIALIRKFGWLADHVGAPMPDVVRSILLDRAGHGTSTTILGPRTRPADARGYQSRWKLTVNVSNGELKESEGLARRHTVKRNA
jgi:predicted transcriptional regulator of viral defense system